MQKKLILFLLVLVSFIIKAQNPLFLKTVDTINVIIKANPLTYYMPQKQYSAFVKKINVTEAGIVNFTDSIPSEIKSTNLKKGELISDCCPRKNSRKLDLLTIKKWDIHFPNAYLKDEKGETIGRILGLKETDLNNLKAQFEILQSLSIAYLEKRKNDEIEARKKMIKELYDCPDPKIDAKKRAAAEAAKKAFELQKKG